MDKSEITEQQSKAPEWRTIEAEIKLSTHKYVEERVAHTAKTIGLWWGTLIAIGLALVGFLGYTRVQDFLSERLQKQVDSFFAEKGGQDLQKKLQLAESKLIESEVVMQRLKALEAQLNQLNALNRLLKVEQTTQTIDSRDLALLSGMRILRKGIEEPFVVGAEIHKIKVSSITIKEGAAVAIVQSDGFDWAPLRAKSNLDKEGKRLDWKGITSSLMFRDADMDMQIIGIEKDGVVIVYRIRPREWNIWSDHFDKPRMSPTTSTAPTTSKGS